MVPFEVGDKWLIARRPHAVSSKGNSGNKSQIPRSRMDHGGCWTGEKWAQQTIFAMMFDSQIEAAEYLEQNRQAINAA